MRRLPSLPVPVIGRIRVLRSHIAAHEADLYTEEASKGTAMVVALSVLSNNPTNSKDSL